MKLIWTYSEYLKKGWNSILENEFILKLYEHSIECAKPFYQTCVYTTKSNYNFFKDKVDEVKLIPDDFDYVFLGDLKYHVIEIEKPPFILIDGDLFINGKLNIPVDSKFGVEFYINNQPDNNVLKFNNCFVQEGIRDIIPYWGSGNISYNLGLVYINTDQYIYEMCNDFKKIKKFYKEIIEPKYEFDKNNKQPSVSGAQYFFTSFLDSKGIKPYDFTSDNNFTHLIGSDKLQFRHPRMIKYII